MCVASLKSRSSNFKGPGGNNVSMSGEPRSHLARRSKKGAESEGVADERVDDEVRLKSHLRANSSMSVLFVRFCRRHEPDQEIRSGELAVRGVAVTLRARATDLAGRSQPEARRGITYELWNGDT
jgi:hypothetical protein